MFVLTEQNAEKNGNLNEKKDTTPIAQVPFQASRRTLRSFSSQWLTKVINTNKAI